MAHYDLKTEQLKEMAPKLRAGDTVTLTGTVYTARDAAHKKIVAAMDAGDKLPFDLDGAAIYYAGPTPAKPGQVIGSVGPTTSGRMDPFAPRLLDAGLACMIGKGVRGQGVLPIIGIVPTQMPEDHIFRVNDHYINSIVLSGGVPLIFPLSQDRRVFERLLPIVDGFVLTGGQDVDPERYGVAEFDKGGNCLSIEEKPEHSKSNYAVVGLYFYPNKVVEVAKHISKSWRSDRA